MAAIDKFLSLPMVHPWILTHGLIKILNRPRHFPFCLNLPKSLKALQRCCPWDCSGSAGTWQHITLPNQKCTFTIRIQWTTLKLYSHTPSSTTNWTLSLNVFGWHPPTLFTSILNGWPVMLHGTIRYVCTFYIVYRWSDTYGYNVVSASPRSNVVRNHSVIG